MPRAGGEALPSSATGASSRPSRSGAGSPGQEAKPCPQAPQAQAPVLREAEQGAPGRGRSAALSAAGASSRPSRSGAGSRAGGEALPPSATGARSSRPSRSGAGSRAGGEALPPSATGARSSRPSRSGAGSPGQEAKRCPKWSPLSLAWIPRKQAEIQADKRSHAHRHIARPATPPINRRESRGQSPLGPSLGREGLGGCDNLNS
ncbi:hypothetical protein ACM7Q1_10115 [Paenibacillus illinoisensis]|uniref:hypothetical protein n=1 Tax=Paenibacillus illinoisensis TaxID=59845 RepID=UPI003A4D9603